MLRFVRGVTQHQPGNPLKANEYNTLHMQNSQKIKNEQYPQIFIASPACVNRIDYFYA
jgi:hypothetical protein